MSSSVKASQSTTLILLDTLSSHSWRALCHASSYFPFNSIVPSTFHGSWIYWTISMLDSLAQPSSEILVNVLASRNMLAKAGERDYVIKTKMVRGFFFLSSSIDSHMYLSCLSRSTYLLANAKAERHKEHNAQAQEGYNVR